MEFLSSYTQRHLLHYIEDFKHRFKVFMEIIRWRHQIILMSYVIGGASLHIGGIKTINLIFILIGSTACVLSVYMYNYLTDVKEDIINNKSNPAHTKEGRNKVKLFVLFSALISLISGYLLNFASLLFLLGFLAIGYLYSAQNIRLKKYFFVKNISISIGWFFIFLFVCSSITKSITLVDLVFAMFFCALSFTGSIVRDVMDMDGDKKAGIRTIPIVLGKKNTGYLFMIVSTIQYGATLILAVLGYISSIYLYIIIAFPTALILVYGILNNNYKLTTKSSLFSYPATSVILLTQGII